MFKKMDKCVMVDWCYLFLFNFMFDKKKIYF